MDITLDAGSNRCSPDTPILHAATGSARNAPANWYDSGECIGRTVHRATRAKGMKAKRKGKGRERDWGIGCIRGEYFAILSRYRVSRSSLYRLSFSAIRRTLRWTAVEFLSTVSPGRYGVTTMYVAVVDPAAFTGNKLVYSCGGTRNGDLIRITENYSNFYDGLKIAKGGSKGEIAKARSSIN